MIDDDEDEGNRHANEYFNDNEDDNGGDNDEEDEDGKISTREEDRAERVNLFITGEFIMTSFALITFKLQLEWSLIFIVDPRSTPSPLFIRR